MSGAPTTVVVEAIVAEIWSVIEPISGIGAAVLGVWVSIKAIRWLRMSIEETNDHYDSETSKAFERFSRDECEHLNVTSEDDEGVICDDCGKYVTREEWEGFMPDGDTDHSGPLECSNCGVNTYDDADLFDEDSAIEGDPCPQCGHEIGFS